MTQNLLPGLANATALGAAPGDTPMSLMITLARPDPGGEQALLDAEHNPASARFGQFLTPAQFASEFGVPQSQFDQVRSWLTGTGLRVGSVSAARDQVNVSGTAAQVSALFGTPIQRFSSAGQTFLANTAAPVLPYGLPITNVIGLNTLQRMSTPAKAAQDTCLGGTCTGVTTPADLWSVYQQPAAYQGQGQPVAIFGEGATDGVVTDLRAFESKFGLPQVPVTVKHPAGDTDFSDDSGHVEWNIDTQASTGMAPKTPGLTLYFGHDLSDADVTKVFSQWTDDANGPKQASASYGECETVPVASPIAGQPLLTNPSLPVQQGLGNNSDATWTQILRQAALEGKTLFSSTGDTGSSCPVAIAPVIGAGNGVLNQGFPATNSPASLPYVVGVGGTVLYTDGAGHRSREYGWAFSGGGSTLFHPAPSYQQGTPGLALTCVTDPLKVCRGISDVAAQSGDVLTNGYSIVSNGKATTGGGTSLSSPLWEGMWARVQSASASPGGNGFANYALYRAGKDPASAARDYFDVNSADPATGLPASNGLYPTAPGWDYVTGWGTPKVDGLICDIDHTGC
ncbi:S8/S53 family peptidase [Amycolatopsis sp. K13G38]|uniref:S8/S53 family peptidase n=1 Tax=Amycolatopsis acididurans TaxID=2724524 RepID=A0ABX1JK48_9PSEU|nr:S53 family peptidase [Amycolatopsis acididurans]NKQ59285.1 S8/S53 family peptidase [Amycolatopsis acididurans]